MKSIITALFLCSILSAYSQVTFNEHQIEYGDTIDPNTLKAADMDGDGLTDLVVAQGLNKVTWYQNLGAGLFSFQKVISSTAMQVKDIDVADIDGDGDLDVISASSQDDAIEWYENQGNGSFTDANSISMSVDGAISVAATDVDNDGDIDVLSVSFNSDEVYWHENTGAGSFMPKVLVTSLFEVEDIKVADFNADGNMDILLFSNGFQDARTLHNNGSGSFGPGYILEDVVTIKATTITDADGDGDLDIVTASTGNVKYYANEGSGNFLFDWTIFNSNDIDDLQAMDMDGDGDEDIAYGEKLTAGLEVGWFRNNGNSGGVANYTRRVVSDLQDAIFSVAPADFNQDGLIDIASANGSSDRVNWHENLGNDQWAPYVTISSNVQDIISDIALVDMDGDGDMDVISSSFEGSNATFNHADDGRVLWHENLGGGDFSRNRIIGLEELSEAPGAIESGDMDGDGDIDVVVHDTYWGSLLYVKNDGNETFTDQETIQFYSSDQLIDYRLGDIDGDGDLDALTLVSSGGTSSNFISWHRNISGSFLFNETVIIPTSAGITGSNTIALYDVDGDGDLDLIAAHDALSNIVWYRNNGSGQFTSALVINPNVNSIRGMALGDMDGDGDIDLVAASFLGQKIILHQNIGAAVFSSEISVLADGIGHTDIILADLTNNGFLDIITDEAAPSHAEGYVENYGSLNFSAFFPLTVALGAAANKAVADINGDGKIDIVFEGVQDSKISWLENMNTFCPPVFTELSASICAEESYSFAGQQLTSSGNFIDTQQNVFGCDSIITLQLTVWPDPSTSFTTAICAGDTYLFNGTSYTTAGSYDFTSSSMVSGCDSTTILNLSVLPTSASTITESICEGTSYMFYGVEYAQAGTYAYVDEASNGCDSIVTLELGILPVPSSITAASICQGMSFDFNGSTYTDSGIYNHAIANGGPCDSIATLDLTVTAALSSEITQSICEGESVEFNGIEYISTGVYSFLTSTSEGCDSIAILNLTVTSILASIAQDGFELSASPSGALYQWLDCDNDLAPIANASAQTFLAPASGSYAVEVSQNGCVAVSECVQLIIDAIVENEFGDGFQVYPNPTKGELSISLGAAYDDVTLNIYTIQGSSVYSDKFLGVELLDIRLDAEPGNYLLHIQTGTGLNAKVRIIKE